MMVTYATNQVVWRPAKSDGVVEGDGAGKTEAAKHILDFFVEIPSASQTPSRVARAFRDAPEKEANCVHFDLLA